MQPGIFPPLNTKADYYLCIQLFEPAKYRQIFQDLLDTRVMWVKDSILASRENGIIDSTHKIVSVPKVGGGEDIYQYILQENPEAKIFRLGFSLEEVVTIIHSTD